MATSRKIHANTNSNPAPKTSKSPEKFRFSTANLLVTTEILTVAFAGTLSFYGCLQNAEKLGKPAKEPAALSSPDSFTVTKTERASVHNSLKTLPSGTSKSVALVVDAGRKTLEGNNLITPDRYEPLVDHFIRLYGEAGEDMVDAALAQVKKLPESEGVVFMGEAHLTIVALLLRPYAAWEGPAVLKELDNLISSQEFSQDSLDNFAGNRDLMKEYYELTMNVGNQLYF